MEKTSVQFHSFPDGGFVLHKVTFPSRNGRFSAWYDCAGAVLDAEQLTGNCSRSVKRDGPIWRALRIVGQRYVKRASI